MRCLLSYPPPHLEGGWSPDSIINCIGITARHINDADPASVARAIVVNAAFPHALAAAAAAHGAKVIHMSTDGVFSGNRTELYAESDTPDATDTYGRTKILGESRAPNVLNIRCSIIGPSPLKREGLWEWVAQQPDGATISGYTNHLWHGATTRQFAELCTSIIADGRFATLRAAGPVFHFTPNEPVTKYDLVCAMRDALGKRLTITPVSHAQPVTRVLVSRGGALPRQDVRAVLRACVETRTSL
ncbi:MAG: sugar nucleotide-binding protein [bacterium]|nr:sugar nucleotide-binding protein [bacterium]